MVSRVKNWFENHPRIRRTVFSVLIALAVLFVALSIGKNNFLWVYAATIALFVFVFRPNSALHTFTVEKITTERLAISIFVAVLTICVCIAPMASLSLWNGEQPGHRNQYELMAEAILDGRVEFAYGDEDALLELENPYDPNERKETGVKYHWDHAYYNGHYYMYFGVVPVFLVFLPYRVLTGESMTTYHATQIFAALIIAGIFMLFYLLAKLFFKKLPFSVYLALSVAFSVASVWYSSAEPALYCTAITAAIALMVWSLYFFVKAVWGETRENIQLIYAAIGALLGALAFGCRPPIALANILVLPMLITFLKQRKFSLKLLGKLVLVALPYVVVAAGLMYYNYIRFDDPFEFGQAYQLTTADQHLYKITWDAPTLVRILNDSFKNFFSPVTVTEAFPYFKTSSVFFNFPIFFLCFAMFKKNVLANMKKKSVLLFAIGVLLTPVIITAIDIMWTPYLLERYRMDIYFLMGIACFLAIGFWYNSCSKNQRKVFSSVLMLLALFTTISAFLLYVRTVGSYYPDKMTEIAKKLSLHLITK